MNTKKAGHTGDRHKHSRDHRKGFDGVVHAVIKPRIALEPHYKFQLLSCILARISYFVEN
jgi:hypothetical protein